MNGPIKCKASESKEHIFSDHYKEEKILKISRKKTKQNKKKWHMISQYQQWKLEDNDAIT